ncbi:MAG: nucleotidyltransferase domain-containing protein, partial [Bacteroidales bacterium]|nr:nucleotidyltransferase domain-containing protein [Bacteroidales bacterium]
MLRFGLSEKVIDDLCGVFRNCPNIEKVYLFGSRAKGTHKEGSDIDLAIVGENIGTNLLLEIQTKIEALE